jgi:hypothetical protein
MPRIIATAVIIAALALFPIARPQTAAIVSLANEKVFINPFTDSSSMQSLDGWPNDTASQELLLASFGRLYKNIFVEFKRCEKFGFYEMVDDSISATVRLQITIRPCSLNKDTLTLPMRIELRHRVGMDTYTNTIVASGIFRGKTKPKSAFHFLDNLLADYRRHFPCRKLAALFYPPRQ